MPCRLSDTHPGRVLGPAAAAVQTGGETCQTAEEEGNPSGFTAEEIIVKSRI